MLSFLHKYGGNVHSQNGEDMIVSEALTRMGITSGHVVEVGANDGHWLSNSRYLIEQGWSATLIECQYDLYLKCKENWKHNPQVRSQCSRVDEKNINAFVKDDCDLLSLDTDGSDYRIFHGLRSKPKIVIVEIDSSIPPTESGFNVDGGAGYLEMLKLGQLRGFFLLCHTGNMVFVDEKYKHLFPEINKDPIYGSEYYFNRSWLKAA